MGKKIIDCIICGERLMPSAWKIGYCKKCIPNITKEHKQLIEIKLTRVPKWQKNKKKRN